MRWLAACGWLLWALAAPLAAQDASSDDPFAAPPPQEETGRQTGAAAAESAAAGADDGEAKCFKIPTADQLGSSEEIINYRARYAPKLYQPEWSGWPWLDLGMLAALLALGCVMVWRQIHYRWFWVPAALTLAYFGVARGGCICPVGSVANFSIGLVHPERVGIATALMFLLPLVVAIFMGRVFCVSGCPLGAMQHLLGGRRFVRLPVWLERVLRVLPVLVLIATALAAVRGGLMLACVLDPYKTAFFWGYGWLHRLMAWSQGGLVEPGWFWVGGTTAWGILAGAILLGFWVYRPFCRFVCPYGVLLGVFSVLAFRRRHIVESNCVSCGVCEKRCPVRAITRDPVTRQFSISNFHCIQCNRCSSDCRKDGIC